MVLTAGVSAQTIWDGNIAITFAGGTGTEADPYKISNGAELARLAAYVNNYFGQFFVLTANIFLNDTANWQNWATDPPARQSFVIGNGVYNTSANRYNSFRGTFDGAGFVISGVYIPSSKDYQGLFGYVGEGGTIKNLGVVASYVKGNGYVGGLVGFADLGVTITNCYATGNVSGEGSYIGGLVGYASGGTTINNSYATGNVSGEERYIGGFVGYAGSYTGFEVTITNCYATGNVLGIAELGSSIGGLVGTLQSATISNSYSTGNVSGTATGTNNVANFVGGLVGDLGSDITIINSYTTGNVSGTMIEARGTYVRNLIGGLVGGAIYTSDITITNCYATGNVLGEGSYIVGGLVGDITISRGDLTITNSYYNNSTEGAINYTSSFGTPKTTAELKQQSTYIGWNFASIWAINAMINDGYPYLRTSHLKVNAVTPTIFTIPEGVATALQGQNPIISVTANAPEDGILSYQWYSNTSASTINGMIITGATNSSYSVPTSVAGTYYYYVIVTNTIPDNGDGGQKTASVTSNTITLIVHSTNSILSPDRMIPIVTPNNETPSVSPINALESEFTVGPNPVSKSVGVVNFFRQGKRIENANLSIYDASGSFVKRIKISDNAIGNQSRRQVGSWDLTDRKGRTVSEGTYLVKGSVKTMDGKREKLSLVLGVR